MADDPVVPHVEPGQVVRHLLLGLPDAQRTLAEHLIVLLRLCQEAGPLLRVHLGHPVVVGDNGLLLLSVVEPVKDDGVEQRRDADTKEDRHQQVADQGDGFLSLFHKSFLRMYTVLSSGCTVTSSAHSGGSDGSCRRRYR